MITKRDFILRGSYFCENIQGSGEGSCSVTVILAKCGGLCDVHFGHDANSAKLLLCQYKLVAVCQDSGWRRSTG